ncbi:Os05g0410701 [Oryza sativa Japonica Group]|nr:Os05g0410701 [Oryza sativa Japonica Group]
MPSCVTVSLMASSFLARQHANATDSRSLGPPRKTATIWSPWFLAAVVSSLVDILVGNWKLAPPLQNGRSVKMPTVHGASSSTLWLSSQQWCSRAPRRTRVLR